MVKEVNYATYSIDHRDNLRIISFNNGFLELTGFTKNDIYQGKLTLQDIIPADIWEEYLIAVNRSSRSEDGAGYFEHPILRKDGSSIVVLCYGKQRDDGSDISDILITDVTSYIEAQIGVIRQKKETRLWLRKLSFISEQEQEFLADYNCSTNHFDITIVKDGVAQNIYSIDNYTSALDHIQTIHPDDLDNYKAIFLDASTHTQKTSFNFRTKLFDDDFVWYRAIYASYYDEEANETHAIARIVNIADEIARNEELKRQAQIDALTSLYNQGTSRTKIDEIALSAPEGHMNAFIIMDLDNFKEVNDHFGHAEGDKVLKTVGCALRQFFKFDSDIIGRLGGDEFVIYMRNVPSKSFVKKYCQELCDEIMKPYTFEGKEFKVTASLGIVIQDNGPDSFDHLYKCADDALYIQKNNSKNGICFYQ